MSPEAAPNRLFRNARLPDGHRGDLATRDRRFIDPDTAQHSMEVMDLDGMLVLPSAITQQG